MKKKSLFYAVIVGLSLNFLSCSKDEESLSSTQKNNFENERLRYSVNATDESIKNDFELKDGILHFKNQESYLKIKNSFVKANIDERVKFAEKLGFESLLSVTQKAIDDINDSKTKEEFDLSTVKYQNLVNNNDGMISSKVTDGYEAALTNKDGIVYIGKMIYMFTPNFEYIIYDGDRAKLNNLKSGRIGESAEVCIFNKRSKTNPNSRECNELRGEETTCCRKAILTVNVNALNVYFNSNGTYTLEAYAYVNGTPFKTSFWGGWTNYTTENSLSVVMRVNIYSSFGSIYYAPANSAPIGSKVNIFGYSNDWTNIDYGATAYAQNVSWSAVTGAFVKLEDNTFVVPYQDYSSYSHRGMGGVIVKALCK